MCVHKLAHVGVLFVVCVVVGVLTSVHCLCTKSFNLYT